MKYPLERVFKILPLDRGCLKRSIESLLNIHPAGDWVGLR